MNKTDLIEVISSRANITKTEAKRIVNIGIDAVIEGLATDGKVTLLDFGTFLTRGHADREGRNPRTGETIRIKGKRTPSFKPGKGMKRIIATGNK